MKLDLTKLSTIELTERKYLCFDDPNELDRIFDELDRRENRPADYEPCGTCGFDHAYDGAYPEVLDKINQSHPSIAEVKS